MLAVAAACVLSSACYVTRTAPRPLVPAAGAPLPLVLLVCENATGIETDALFAPGRLFRAVTTDPLAPAHLVVDARLAGRRDRTLVSAGFFFWTFGVIPWVTRAERTVELRFRRAGAGGASCGPPVQATEVPVGGAVTPRADSSMFLTGEGDIVSVQGWLALLLQPTPWWSGDAVNWDLPPGQVSLNLSERTRAAVARAVLRRAEALRALAEGAADPR